MTTKRFDALCATTICATNLEGTNLDFDNIYAGTLSASTLSGDIISGGNAYVETISAETLSSTDVHATTVSATTVSSDSGYYTTVTGTTLSGDTISGGNIYGNILSGTTFSGTTFSGSQAYITNIVEAPTLTLSASTAICADGIFRLANSGVCWEDLQIPGLAAGIGAAAPDLVTLCGSVLGRGFDGLSTTEQLYLAVQLPHRYKTGTELHPHVHWCKSTEAEGSVVWALEYTAAISGQQYGEAVLLSAISDPGSAIKLHEQTDLGTIDGSGFNQSTMIMCRLFRPHDDDNDTYTSDAILLACDFHYQVDSFGSDFEYSKTLT